MNAHKYAGLAWPSLFVIITATYAYWASQRELVSSRPIVPGVVGVPEPVPTPGIQTLHSRMWEDPLSIANQNWKTRLESGAITDLPWAPGRDAELITDEDLSKLADSNFVEQLRSYAPLTQSNSANSYQQHFADLVRTNPTLCLPVLIPGGPYAESKEKRMRVRYSIVTALAESGYHLQYPERMSYLPLKVWVRTLRGWIGSPIVLPIKLYRADNSPTQILVLWIDESQIGLRPLLALHRILNDVFSAVKVSDQDNLQVALIGPAASGMLKEIEEEVNHLAEARETIRSVETDSSNSLTRWEHWKIAGYDPQCAPRLIRGFCPLLREPCMIGQEDTNSPIPIYSSRATIEKVGFAKQPYFHLKRVVGTDLQLVHALHQELAARNCLGGEVVLITEHDTAYGREIQRTFEKVFEATNLAPDKRSKIVTYKILKGLDGALPGDAREATGGGKSKGTDGNPGVVERLPEGRSQFDYLTRLPEILTSNDELPKAIGIVGSDIYDKLLVLRALKPKFPASQFFTTDTDAIYVHTDERPHTRDLLIATHFDLRLSETFQHETAPFRDSYQTAAFLATRLAVVEFTRLDYELKRLALRTSRIPPLAGFAASIEGVRIALREHPSGFDDNTLSSARPQPELSRSVGVAAEESSAAAERARRLHKLWTQLWILNESLNLNPDKNEIDAELARPLKLSLRTVAGFLAFDRPTQDVPIFPEISNQLGKLSGQFVGDVAQVVTGISKAVEEAEDGWDLLQLKNRISVEFRGLLVDTQPLLDAVDGLAGLEPHLNPKHATPAAVAAERINRTMQHDESPWLNPIIQVVGRSRLHRIESSSDRMAETRASGAAIASAASPEGAASQPDDYFARVVHPNVKVDHSLNDLAFATIVIVVIICIGGIPATWPALASAMDVRKPLSAAGCVWLATPVLGGLATFAAWSFLSRAQAAPFDGYSTGSRDLLYFFSGCCNLSLIAFLAARYNKVLTDSRTDRSSRYGFLSVVVCLTLFLIYAGNVVLWGGAALISMISFGALTVALVAQLGFELNKRGLNRNSGLPSPEAAPETSPTAGELLPNSEPSGADAEQVKHASIDKNRVLATELQASLEDAGEGDKAHHQEDKQP